MLVIVGVTLVWLIPLVISIVPLSMAMCTPCIHEPSEMIESKCTNDLNRRSNSKRANVSRSNSHVNKKPSPVSSKQQQQKTKSRCRKLSNISCGKRLQLKTSSTIKGKLNKFGKSNIGGGKEEMVLGSTKQLALKNPYIVTNKKRQTSMIRLVDNQAYFDALKMNNDNPKSKCDLQSSQPKVPTNLGYMLNSTLIPIQTDSFVISPISSKGGKSNITIAKNEKNQSMVDGICTKYDSMSRSIITECHIRRIECSNYKERRVCDDTNNMNKSKTSDFESSKNIL